MDEGATGTLAARGAAGAEPTGTAVGSGGPAAGLAEAKALLAAVEQVHAWLDADPLPDGEDPVTGADVAQANRLLGLLAQADASLLAARSRLVATCARAGVPRADGAATTAAWLAARTRRSGRSAATETRDAIGLAEHPQLLAALRGGEISADHAREVLAAVRQQHQDLDAAHQAREDQAREREDARRQAEAAALAVARDAEERARLQADAEARRRRHEERQTAERLRRAAQAEAAARQSAARLTDLARTGSPEQLRRTALARRHTHAAAGQDPLARAEAAQHARRSLRLGHDRHTGMGRASIELPAADHELLTGLLDALTRPDSETTPPEQQRSSEQRRYDALSELLHRAAAVADLGSSNGHRPVLTVRTSLSQLRGELTEPGGPRVPGLGRWDTPLSGETVDRLACDSAIVRLLTTDEGHLLSIGRATRTWNGAQRRFVEARDGGCVFPGCDRPPAWCDIHHLVYWRDGGRTDVDNGVLLCRRHHRIVHHDGWTLTFDPRAGLVTATRRHPDHSPETRTRQVTPTRSSEAAGPPDPAAATRQPR